jgi:hypothetical protein
MGLIDIALLSFHSRPSKGGWDEHRLNGTITYSGGPFDGVAA